MNPRIAAVWLPTWLAVAALTAPAAEKIAPKTLEFLQATELSGHVQASYQYTFDHNGNPGRAGGRQFNNSGSDFSLNQARVTLEKPLGDSDYAAGYRVDFLAGQDAERIHSYGLFSSNANELSRRQGYSSVSGDSSADAFDLEQAYVSFRIPVGSGLDVKFGKFVSPAGAEKIDAPANWFFSHSYIFSYGEPFTLTGALLNYRWNDLLDTQLGVVNGWDVVTDNNSGKTVLGSVSLTLWDGKLKNALTAMGGPEQDSNNSRYRWIADDVLTWQPPMENLLLQLNAMYGNEDGTIDSAGYFHRGSCSWWGALAAARYQWTPFVSMGLRYEYFSDGDGARTDGAQGLRASTSSQSWLTAGYSDLRGVDYQAVTWAIWLEKLFPNFTPRVEVRWDRANEAAFGVQDKNGVFSGGEHTQVTVSFDATYVF